MSKHELGIEQVCSSQLQIEAVYQLLADTPHPHLGIVRRQLLGGGVEVTTDQGTYTVTRGGVTLKHDR